MLEKMLHFKFHYFIIGFLVIYDFPFELVIFVFNVYV